MTPWTDSMLADVKCTIAVAMSTTFTVNKSM